MEPLNPELALNGPLPFQMRAREAAGLTITG